MRKLASYPLGYTLQPGISTVTSAILFGERESREDGYRTMWVLCRKTDCYPVAGFEWSANMFHQRHSQIKDSGHQDDSGVGERWKIRAAECAKVEGEIAKAYTRSSSPGGLWRVHMPLGVSCRNQLLVPSHPCAESPANTHWDRRAATSPQEDWDPS